MSPPPFAVVTETAFDGGMLHHDCAVLIEGPRIKALVPRAELPSGLAVQRLPEGAWLAPGFIDAQVNGGGDVLFNDAPTPEGIARIVNAHRRLGTTALLPTLLSDGDEKMRAALVAVEQSLTVNPGVLGIHLEGPFLSPEKPGVHDPAAIRRPEPQHAEMLSRRQGVTVVTLAPERVPAGFIAQLVRGQVRVCLGHSMATYAQTRAAIAEGLTGFTHLFNAMRPLGSREPGPIAAALEDPNVCFSIIVDAHHVDPAMLRLALRGAARPLLVSDAMPPVGGERRAFMLNGHRIETATGCCVRADGVLAGSCLDMATAVRNCVELLRVPLSWALHAGSAAPAAFLGLGHVLGRLAPGYRADMVAFQPNDIRVLQTWVAGQPSQ